MNNVCSKCGGRQKAFHEPANLWCGSFFSFGCDCEDPEDWGYGPTQELAERDYRDKHRSWWEKAIIRINNLFK